MDLPPGLGLDSPGLEQAKAKNPRRKAKKQSQKGISRPQAVHLAEAENGGLDAAPQASSSASAAIVIEPAAPSSGTASAQKPKLNPATERLLAQLTASSSGTQTLPGSSGSTDPPQSTQEPPATQPEQTPKQEKKAKTPASEGNRRARRQSRAAAAAASAAVSLTETDPYEVHSLEPAGSPSLANGGETSAAPPRGEWPSSEPPQVATPTGAWPTSEAPDDSATKSRSGTQRRSRRYSRVAGSPFTSGPGGHQAGTSSGDPDAHQVTGFIPHWEGRRLQQALKRGQVLRCEFRVNAGDRRQGYAGLAGLEADIQIQGLENQNRAVPGDQVAVQILPQSQWLSQRVNIMSAAKKLKPGSADNPKMEALEGLLQEVAVTPPQADCDEALAGAASPEEAHKILNDKISQARTPPKSVIDGPFCRLIERPDLRATGRVVAILEPSPRRNRVVGVLQQEARACMLIPVDPRMPKGYVQVPKLLAKLRAELQAADQKPESQTLVSAMMGAWPESSYYPEMEVRESLGQAGEIEVETKAILEMEGVDTEPFDADVLACLPQTPWSIGDDEVAKRRDLRSLRLFSIDPPTARDLDDALSIEDLGGGRWRVGVHIADVSHFISPGSALDAKAARRATSVYLVQRVIPMLPPLLCEELCSLNPGVDRLSFSVIWEMDEEGQVLSQWTGRTVIRSCAKLAYPHAQAMIDGAYAAREGEEPPVPLEAPHTWPQVVGDVLALNKIARNLNRRRFENGALRLDNAKLSFELDSNGNPSTTHIYEQKESNELVAEFMLLANMSVAQLIGMAFPDKAMLRRHPTPEDRKMGELEAAAQKLGYDIDCTTAGTIQESLKRLRRSGEDPTILDILQLMATKPMKQAQYFSTGTYTEIGDWRHYALALPMYTHFTSPIRRYPDVIVHRLLARLLAQDPRAQTQVFNPAPVGTLERDKAEGKIHQQQQAAVAALEELAADGEDAEALQDDLATSAADLTRSMEVAELPCAPEAGSTQPTAAPTSSAQPVESEVDCLFQPETSSLSAADSNAQETGGPNSTAALTAADEGDASQPDASVIIAVTDRRSQPASETSQIDCPAAEKQAEEEESSDGSPPAGLRMEASSSGADVEEEPTQSSQEQRPPEPAQPVGGSPGTGEWPQIETAEEARPQPRLIARKVGEGRRRGKDSAKPAGAGSRAKTIPVSKELLESKDLQKVADHCNERKTAAKACSEASSRLYLCVMLRAQPMVLEAVVTVVNGSRFFDLYVPLLGIESRIQVHEVLPTVEARWDAEARCVTLTERPGKDETQPSESDAGPPCLAAISNADKLQNTWGLQPLPLPLEIRAFVKVPVVVCAKSPGNAKPLFSYALLYLRASSGRSLQVQGAAVSLASTDVDAEEMEGGHDQQLAL